MSLMSVSLKIIFFVLLCVYPAGLFAQSEGILNSLLAPGPMMTGHSNLEGSKCLKCHTAGQGVPNSKCLECHKEIKPFIEQKKGFHGLHEKSCRECHAEHKGRDNDTTLIDQKNFDHGVLTGYKLEGKHNELKCEKCHHEKRKGMMVRSTDIKYLGKASSCLSCHKKDDVHYFKGQWAKKDCSICHGLKSWKQDITFDHEKDTKYKLEGKHAETKCSSCHGITPKIKSAIYKWPNLNQKQCLSCHETVHKGHLSQKFQGGNCNSCHNQKEWKISSFDHKITKYPLKGKHSEIKCEDCHKQKKDILSQISKKNYHWMGLKTQCLSCHQDYHKFGDHKNIKLGNLNACSQCHDESKWSSIRNFSHNNNTRYKIDGKHLDLKCNECHLPKSKISSGKNLNKVGTYHWENLNLKTCETCHDSPHKKVFSADLLKKKCTDCHITEDWYAMKDGKGFDHGKTRFPLTGAHLKTRCSDCHGSKDKQTFKFKNYEKQFCIDCHQGVHDKQFNKKFAETKCSDCHTTNNFTERKDFDHKLTRFALKGAHEKLKCSECHTQTSSFFQLFKPNFNSKQNSKAPVHQMNKFIFPDILDKQCLNCHTDIHNGQVSNQCLNCHSNETWKIKQFDHGVKTKFPLLDKHSEVKCEKCHAVDKSIVKIENKKSYPLIKYAPISKQCVDCHKDPHKGNLGKSCQECHSEKGWSVVRDFHRNFTLTGVHYTLECAECHRDGRKLVGLSQQCISCHQKDDIHNGTLPNCKDCHRQQFWEVTSFRHSLSRFPLRGAHRTLECMDCHRQTGTYQGLSSDCSSCHLSEALAVSSPAHSGFSNLNSCTECHKNQFTFRGAQ